MLLAPDPLAPADAQLLDLPLALAPLLLLLSLPLQQRLPLALALPQLLGLPLPLALAPKLQHNPELAATIWP